MNKIQIYDYLETLEAEVSECVSLYFDEEKGCLQSHLISVGRPNMGDQVA